MHMPKQAQTPRSLAGRMKTMMLMSCRWRWCGCRRMSIPARISRYCECIRHPLWRVGSGRYRWCWRTSSFFIWLLRLLATLPEALLSLRFDLGSSTRRHEALPRAYIRFLTSPLAPRLDVSPTRAAATQPHLYQPGENCECAGDPHEHE